MENLYMMLASIAVVGLVALTFVYYFDRKKSS